MIPLLIGTGVSLVGSLVGGISASKKAKEAEKMLKKEQAVLDDWYAKQLNTDYLDTDSAKSTLAHIESRNKKNEQALTNSMIKGGATAEERVASASALNKNYADAMSGMAATDTARKSEADSMYMSGKSNLISKEHSQMLGSASAATLVTSLASGIGNTVAKLDGAGMFDKKKKSK